MSRRDVDVRPHGNLPVESRTIRAVTRRYIRLNEALIDRSDTITMEDFLVLLVLLVLLVSSFSWIGCFVCECVLGEAR